MSPWLLWRSWRAPAFRQMVLERLGVGLPKLQTDGKKRVLVHGVSVGEVKAALAIVRAMENAYPQLEIWICTSTNTGTKVAHDLFPKHQVVRFPADISFVIRRFLRRVNPSLVLLIELEIWPNFLRICNREKRTVAVVNGRITEMSHGYYLLTRHVLPQFNRVSLFCVQLEEYAARFRKLGVGDERIFLSGNIKVDGLQTGPIDPGEELTLLLGGTPGQLVLVAGSTHADEELSVAKAWREYAPEARLVVVPRHPERCGAVVALLASEGFQAQRLGQLRAGVEKPDPNCMVLVDTIGELERVYGLSDLVFVGASLVPKGGQNVLEPAAQGRAMIFGPHMRNFRQEVAMLRDYGACRQIANEAELGPALREMLDDAQLRQQMGAAGMRAVSAQKGASQKTLAALAALVLDRIGSQ
jgi:3-deoxy-D-manno-octulosonic-acid transferase